MPRGGLDQDDALGTGRRRDTRRHGRSGLAWSPGAARMWSILKRSSRMRSQVRSACQSTVSPAPTSATRPHEGAWRRQGSAGARRLTGGPRREAGSDPGSRGRRAGRRARRAGRRQESTGRLRRHQAVVRCQGDGTRSPNGRRRSARSANTRRKGRPTAGCWWSPTPGARTSGRRRGRGVPPAGPTGHRATRPSEPRQRARVQTPPSSTWLDRRVRLSSRPHVRQESDSTGIRLDSGRPSASSSAGRGAPTVQRPRVGCCRVSDSCRRRFGRYLA